MPKPNDVGVGTALIIISPKGEILLGKRKGSHAAGNWSVPGGWLDRDDKTTAHAVVREVAEETDLIFQPSDVHSMLWTTEDHPDFRSVTLYHYIELQHEVFPRTREPHKCEGWQWFPLQELPSPLFPELDKAIDHFIRTHFKERA
jgi:8-oxo-dGTP diphosphatase